MIIDRDLGIPLPDGTRLSAKLWLPDSADSDPVPAILEYLPYRKSDGTAARDDTLHPWFAERGYACLRVDRRGCGDSQGLFDDEYSEQELQDGEDIIAWIAIQPWCNGRIGMQGISWGGFNGLQIAARAPDALKAVISIGTTVDRFNDDIHYKGGVQLSENIGWAATAMSWFSMPADPDLNADWREQWLDRLEHTPFLAKTWMEHANRDEYWRHGSICEDYTGIQAAVLVMGGLHDGYRNAMAAVVENVTAPAKGIVGPWSHKYPHISTIEPSIDYHGVALRWWDKWLKEIDNGAEHDPAYRAYAMQSVKPDISLDERPGKWLAIQDWPSPGVKTETLPLGNGILGRDEPFSGVTETNMSCGQACGEFFPFGFGPGELPDDQAIDDALSICFDSEKLGQEKDLLGAAELRLRLSASEPKAQLIARLSDVRPDGTVNLISMGILDLRHRGGFEEKRDLVPGKTYDIHLKLDEMAYTLAKGHRLRLAISGSYWPFCWPEGRGFGLTVTSGTLSIPVWQGSTETCAFDPPIKTQTRNYRNLKQGHESKRRYTDADGRIVLEIQGDHGRQEDVETGLITESGVSERWSIMPDDPASAEAEIIWTRSFGRGDWEVSSRVTAQMRGLRDSFEIRQRLEAWEGDALIFDRTFNERIER